MISNVDKHLLSCFFTSTSLICFTNIDLTKHFFLFHPTQPAQPSQPVDVSVLHVRSPGNLLRPKGVFSESVRGYAMSSRKSYPAVN